jgi:nicotinate-nucleotide adenylyltransferase
MAGRKKIEIINGGFLPAECIVLLGGSFDPVHMGHVAIAEHFCTLFRAEELRLIPAGRPWQKSRLQATPEQRIAMLRLAFDGRGLPVTIDTRETDNASPGYTVDTLRAIRQKSGNAVSLIFILGADQLHNLDTWHEWKRLFELAHLAVAARPGFDVSPASLPHEVAQAVFSRLASPEEIRNTPGGMTWIDKEASPDISATAIRDTLWHSDTCHSLMPPGVPEYIMKHNLYRN